MAVLTLALLFAGLALLVAEAHLPTFGIVGAGGVAAIVAGIVLATVGAGGSVALALGLAVPVAIGGVAVGAVALRRRARRRAGGRGAGRRGWSAGSAW